MVSSSERARSRPASLKETYLCVCCRVGRRRRLEGPLCHWHCQLLTRLLRSGLCGARAGTSASLLNLSLSRNQGSRFHSRSRSRIENENENDEIAAFYILQNTRTPSHWLCWYWAAPPLLRLPWPPRQRPIDDAVDEPEGDVVQLGDRVWPRLREIRVADGVTALEVVLSGFALQVVAAVLGYARGPVLVLVRVLAV